MAFLALPFLPALPGGRPAFLTPAAGAAALGVAVFEVAGAMMLNVSIFEVDNLLKVFELMNEAECDGKRYKTY
jgi:hypothetical protein